MPQEAHGYFTLGLSGGLVKLKGKVHLNGDSRVSQVVPVLQITTKTYPRDANKSIIQGIIVTNVSGTLLCPPPEPVPNDPNSLISLILVVGSCCGEIPKVLYEI